MGISPSAIRIASTPVLTRLSQRGTRSDSARALRALPRSLLESALSRMLSHTARVCTGVRNAIGRHPAARRRITKRVFKRHWRLAHHSRCHPLGQQRSC
jgi:hypothetical protein